MDVIPFKPEHYADLATVAFEWMLAPLKTGEQLAERGPAYTALEHEQVVACAGVEIMWPGLGVAWAIVTPNLKEPLRLHYAVKAHLREIIHTKRLRRVDAFVQADIIRNLRWAFALGFRIEGEMKVWGPNGEDFLRLVRFA